MIVKFEYVPLSINGDTSASHYIRKYKKHWWNRWKITMDGNIPARYDKISGVMYRRV